MLKFSLLKEKNDGYFNWSKCHSYVYDSVNPCKRIDLLHFFFFVDNETTQEGVEGEGDYDEEMEFYNDNEAGHCEDEDFNVSS